MAAKQVHLKETVLGSDKTLGEDKVVERCGTDVRYSVHIPLNGDGRGEAGNSERTVDLGKRNFENMLHVAASSEEGGQAKDEQNGDSDGE
jgi:hypothetical protein